MKKLKYEDKVKFTEEAIELLKKGKSREEIERLTDCNISVYGKTVGIIGETTKVSIAREAVAMLLSGSQHKTVFTFLEKKKKEIMFG